MTTQTQTMKDNYAKLASLFGGTLTNLPEAAKSERPNLMTAHFDKLYPDPTQANSLVVSIAHYYKQNGDCVPDPDMELRINFTEETLEGLTFQNSMFYQRVYDDNNRINPRLHRSVNDFLTMWLDNLISQGHTFVEDVS